MQIYRKKYRDNFADFDKNIAIILSKKQYQAINKSDMKTKRIIFPLFAMPLNGENK